MAKKTSTTKKTSAAKKQKVKRFSLVTFDNEHYKRTEAYTKAVETLFNNATSEIAKAAAKGEYDPDKPFSFNDYPSVKAVMQSTTEQLASRVKAVIETGSKNEWLYACEKNDEFLESILETSKLSKEQLSQWQDQNLDALKTFQERKVNGLGLSQRVWNYVDQYKEQLESALDVGLGEGRSAAQLARDIRENLKEPDRLFRRVRDKRGNLVLSKAAKAYHPGRGIYRSSTKNAQRLTRSEINMAYRESDHLRWKTLDFVVGFTVKRSNHKPQFECDTCEKLKGDYPKDFKFVGWHPQCRCYAIPILMDEETLNENRRRELKAALRGEEYKKLAAKNAVTDVPENFKQWVRDHAAYYASASANGTLPYFLRDNQETVDWIINIMEIEKALGITKGKEMSFAAANALKGNPNYGTGDEYNINCQCCVVANELRRRGFDVKAQPNYNIPTSAIYKLSYKTELAWLDKSGGTPVADVAGGTIKDENGNDIYDIFGDPLAKSYTEMMSEFNDLTKAQGRYHISFAWSRRSGHIITAERLSNGKIRAYDPQSGNVIADFEEYAKQFYLPHGIKVLKVDKLRADTNIIGEIVEKS